LSPEGIAPSTARAAIARNKVVVVVAAVGAKVEVVVVAAETGIGIGIVAAIRY
jgi:hypothetical protein